MQHVRQPVWQEWPAAKSPPSKGSPCAPRDPAERLSAFHRLEAAGERVKLSEGDLLVREGQSSDENFTVIEGALMLYKSLPGGRRQVVGFHFPGELVTLRRCSSTWPVSICALSPSMVCRLPCEAFRHLAESDPAVCQTVLDMAGDEISARQEQLLTVGRKNTVERIAAFLLEIQQRTRRGEEPGNEVLLPMNRAAIADYLGLKTETVSRAFARLIQEQIVTLPRPSHVVILDRQALAALAAGRPPRSREHAVAAR